MNVGGGLSNWRGRGGTAVPLKRRQKAAPVPFDSERAPQKEIPLNIDCIFHAGDAIGGGGCLVPIAPHCKSLTGRRRNFCVSLTGRRRNFCV